jgi:hypothetical protein
MLCGMRWLLMSKIPLDHTDLPLFSRYFTSINMVIFFVALAVSAVCACLFVWGWCPWRCQLTCLRCSSASVTHVLFFFCYLQLFICKFCCWPRLSRRRRSEAWIRLICPRLPVLGSPSFMVAFFVLTSRRLTHLWWLSTSRDWVSTC